MKEMTDQDVDDGRARERKSFALHQKDLLERTSQACMV